MIKYSVHTSVIKLVIALRVFDYHKARYLVYSYHDNVALDLVTCVICVTRLGLAGAGVSGTGEKSAATARPRDRVTGRCGP